MLRGNWACQSCYDDARACCEETAAVKFSSMWPPCPSVRLSQLTTNLTGVVSRQPNESNLFFGIVAALLQCNEENLRSKGTSFYNENSGVSTMVLFGSVDYFCVLG